MPKNLPFEQKKRNLNALMPGDKAIRSALADHPEVIEGSLGSARDAASHRIASLRSQ
jgi:hypothetical protein